ncbi:MAG: hypothetical protein AAFR56_12455, partial [Chloroflexota bacterium]
MKKYLLIAILMCCVGLLPAQAQTPIPQFVNFTTAEPAFPAGIYFRANGDIPPEVTVASLTLLVQPESAPTQTFQIPVDDPEVFELDGRTLSVNFVWQFETAAEAPDIFTDVAYTWTLVTADGRQDAIGETVRYLDERTRWSNALNDDLSIELWYGRDDFSARRFFDLVDPAYERMASRTQEL